MKWLSERLLQDLHSTFLRIEGQFDLITKIDRAILSSEDGIDDILQNICSDLITIAESDYYVIFFFTGEECLLMGSSDKAIIDESLKSSIMKARHKISKGRPHLMEIRSKKKMGKCIAIPIMVKNELFATIIIEENQNPNRKLFFEDAKFQEFTDAIANQIGILISKILYNQEIKCQRNLIRTFFDQKLKPRDCWKKIVDGIVDFLPNWKVAQITPPPKAQLLLYNEGNKHLTIVATQGDEPINTSVLIDSSVCGMLIKNRSKDWLLLDPNDHKDIYKGFLMESANNILHSELAVAIVFNNEIIGLINLEHSDKNIFKECHREAVRNVAKFIAPFVSSLKERYSVKRSNEIGLLYVMTNLLNRMGSQYQHLLGHPIVKARLKLEELIEAIEKGENNAKELVNDIHRYIDDIAESSDNFCEALPEFISYGPKNIKLIIKEALQPFDYDKLKRNENISISFEMKNNDCEVFASKLLREHIYNLIDNSLHAIRKAISKGLINEGKIDISVKRDTVKDKLESNTPTTFITVNIEDNGCGVPKNDEHKIGKVGFTTKGEHGSGFGFVAVKEYMESVDGKFDFINKPEKGFTVIFSLQEFNPSIHKKIFI